MRRLAAIALILLLGTTLVASAAYLEVDGGMLQVFRSDVDLEVPDEPACVDGEDVACEAEKDSQQKADSQPNTSMASESTVGRGTDEPGSSAARDSTTTTTSTPPHTTGVVESDSSATLAPPPTTETSVQS